MKITGVETFVLSTRRMLVKVSTDEGVSGWGEPVLEGWVLAVRGAIERMSEHLLGRDPRQITRLWQLMARGGFYRDGAVLASAVAGLDQALWDLTGHWYDTPIHELLGGPCRDRVRVYSHANIRGRTGDVEAARRLVAAGITMIKVAPEDVTEFLDSPANVSRVVDELTELREAVGNNTDIALDLHGRHSVAGSIRLLQRLEPLTLAFVEEPLRPEHTHRLHDITHSTTVPIATGERLYSRADFRPAIDAGIAIAQPDLSHAGGITECFRIATMAETSDVQIAPHCPLGPVAFAACLQLDLAIPNAYVQEQGLGLHDLDTADVGLVSNPEALALVDGAVPRLTGPGLGIEINEEAVRHATLPRPVTGGSPTWQTADGGFAEW